MAFPSRENTVELNPPETRAIALVTSSSLCQLMFFSYTRRSPQTVAITTGPAGTFIALKLVNESSGTARCPAQSASTTGTPSLAPLRAWR